MSRRRVHSNPVLAPLVRWLWWSPWRFAAGVVVALVVAAALSAVVRGSNTRHQAAPAPSLPASASASGDQLGSVGAALAEATIDVAATSAAPTTPPASPPAVPAAARSQVAAATVAVTWTRLWARPKLTAAAWLAGLKPYTYAEYRNVLATVNPATIPATRLGRGRAGVWRFAQGAAHVRVPVAGGEVKAVNVTVIFLPMAPGGHWQVSAVAPA